MNMHRIRRLNERIALLITRGMSSMWCVYLFLIWSLVPMFLHGSETMIMYISGGIIQLVALPILAAGQIVSERKQERREQQDHVTLSALLHEMRAMHASMQCRIDTNIPQETNISIKLPNPDEKFK